MKKFTIYVMVGIPGSGKSTWVKNNLGKNFPVVSRDLIREELGFCQEGEKIVGTREQEEKVTKRQIKMIDWYLKRNISFAIDDTNLGRYLPNLIETLRKSPDSPEIVGVILNTPVHKATKRRPTIPVDVLVKMKRNQNNLDFSLFDKIITSKGY